MLAQGPVRLTLVMLISLDQSDEQECLSSSVLLRQVYSQERVFISHAGPQKGFALHLRSRLRDAGVSAFVDERELLPGADHSAIAILEAGWRPAGWPS